MADGSVHGNTSGGHAGSVAAPSAEVRTSRGAGRGRQGAGSPGSVGVLLDGRYRLLQRRTRDGAAATWDGEDDQLLRPVVVTVVSGPTAAEAVDAARRSATLEDERLPHLLDVGLERAVDGTALGWVVTERPPGRTLAELLREAPLPAARARALVGEAAAVLARGSRSGLHHRRLEPTAVLLTADGAVSVLGLEVAAAGAGAPPKAPAEADREDAEGLVRLLYAALTGLWPAGRCGALGAAPTGRGGSPVAPGELAPAVPHDLDALCAAVLGPYREGPATPAEVASALAPWGSSTGPVTRTGLGFPAAPPSPQVRAQVPTEPHPGPGTPRAAGPADPGAWASAPVRARLGGGPGLHFSGADDAARPAADHPTDHPTDRPADRAADRAADLAVQPAADPALQPAVDLGDGAAASAGSAPATAAAAPAAPARRRPRRGRPAGPPSGRAERAAELAPAVTPSRPCSDR